jgi:hypothetical protein
VATILPFIRARADFDDETTRLMGEAFDAARASLDGQDEPELFYEIIAARIVEAAKKGERDPIRLRDIGLARSATRRTPSSSSCGEWLPLAAMEPGVDGLCL